MALVLTGSALPLPLRAIPDPPARLFCRGDPASLAKPSVAVVGSRRCTRQGAQLAFELGRDLAARGVVVVSGLAYGIDAAAHGGALAAIAEEPCDGATVAVLGGGLDRIYPSGHRPLAAQIVAAGGAVVSEYEPAASARKHHFPARNRIVSGLCLGVVIVEASARSGSLITARMALEQGREVMAMPSLIASPLSAGCHRLIREGAALVESAEQVLEELRIERPEPKSPPAALSAQDDAVLAAVQATTTAVDAIVATTALPLPEVLQRLAELEIDGAVVARGGGYALARAMGQR